MVPWHDSTRVRYAYFHMCVFLTTVLNKIRFTYSLAFTFEVVIIAAISKRLFGT